MDNVAKENIDYQYDNILTQKKLKVAMKDLIIIIHINSLNICNCSWYILVLNH